MKNRVEFLVFNLLLLLVRLTPNSWLPFLGARLGRFVHFLGVRKEVVLKNLEIAFGNELSLEERQQLCRKTFENYGIVLLEVLMLRSIKVEQLRNYIEIEGMDILKQSMSEGKGVVMAGNHFGNWELITAAISTMGFPIHIYAGKQRNNLFDDALNNIRQRFGTITISKSRTATIEMMKALRRNQVLGMAGDLNVPNNKQFIEFFGKQAAVGRGLSSFTLSKQCPLVFIWCTRESGLKYKGFITRLDYEVTGDKSRDLLYISQIITRSLEEKIREYPDQYFWFNKRWKTRPENEPELEDLTY